MPILGYDTHQITQGDADFICNWLGNYAWTEALDWPGKQAYNKVDLTELTFGDGRKIGQVKSHGNLTFMRVYAAGHMVPLNQPEGSQEIVNSWINGKWAPKGF